MIGFEYIFGINESKIDSVLGKIIFNNNLNDLQKYYIHYEESIDFINRHQCDISHETYQSYYLAKKYLINYGYIFFLKIDYALLKNLSYNEVSWLVSYFNDVYNNISESNKTKFIDSIEKKIYQNGNSLFY